MNGIQFRTLHGDPGTWTDTQYEQYSEVAAPGAPAPAEVIAFLKQPPPARNASPDYQPAA